MKKIDVMKKGEEWVGKSGGNVVAHAPTKGAAVREVAAKAGAASRARAGTRSSGSRPSPGPLGPQRWQGVPRLPFSRWSATRRSARRVLCRPGRRC